MKKESCEANTKEDFETTDEILSNIDISNPFEILQKQKLCPKPASKTVYQDQTIKEAKDSRAENVDCVEEPEVAMIMSKVPSDPEVPTSKSEPDNLLVHKYTRKMTE